MTKLIETGDIVRVEGNDNEWRVYWIYRDGQLELVHAKHGNSQYGESVTIDKVTLVRKGEKET